jgi:hypothetical protein
MSPSDRLDDCLQTVVVARPGQPGIPLAVSAEIVAGAVRANMSIRERAAQTWRWRRRMDATVSKRRSN